MSRFRQDTCGPAVRLLDAYWTDLRAEAGGNVPYRAAIAPRGLDSVLDRIFILERIASGFARIRLSGQRLTDFADVEARGLPLSALFSAEARDELAGLLVRLFSTPATITLDLSIKSGPGGTASSAQMQLMPLRDNAGRITRAIGAFADPFMPLGNGPRRFTIARASVKDIPLPDGTRLNRDILPDVQYRAFAEDAEPLLRPGPRLRVIDVGDTD